MKQIGSLFAVLTCVVSLACAQAAAGPGSFSGKVVETTNGGSYTFVLLDAGTNKVWAATTQFQVKPGDQVAAADSMPMKDFPSKALNKDIGAGYKYDVTIEDGKVAVE